MAAQECVGFESYDKGSWRDVQISKLRSGKFLVFYEKSEDECAWLAMSQLRLSSRRADGWDCYILKPGMDVSIVSEHPHSNAVSLQKEALYDARVSSVSRSKHAPGKCSCKFAVQLFSVKMDTYIEESLLDRRLLTDFPEKEVSISNMRILQQPAEIISLDEVIQAHLNRVWIPRGRACKDAYFLTETDLTRKPRRDSPEDDTGPTNVRSDEVLSPSPARVSSRSGYKESNCNSTAEGHEQVGLGSRQSPDTVDEEPRMPKSASGAQNNHKENPSAENTDPESPLSNNIKRQRASVEDQKDEERLRKPRRGRPRKNVQEGVRVTRERVHNNPDVKLAPGLTTERRRRQKETRHIEEVNDELDTSEAPDTSSSADSDSKDEYRPPNGLKGVSLKYPGTLLSSKGRHRIGDKEVHPDRPGYQFAGRLASHFDDGVEPSAEDYESDVEMNSEED